MNSMCLQVGIKLVHIISTHIHKRESLLEGYYSPLSCYYLYHSYYTQVIYELAKEKSVQKKQSQKIRKIYLHSFQLVLSFSLHMALLDIVLEIILFFLKMVYNAEHYVLCLPFLKEYDELTFHFKKKSFNDCKCSIACETYQNSLNQFIVWGDMCIVLSLIQFMTLVM